MCSRVVYQWHACGDVGRWDEMRANVMSMLHALAIKKMGSCYVLC